ncbi:MAG TPA: pilus assembly PilX N-terminal domain-containing protein [bacterium]|nr:pilus assembly PilX N-terminal domain-containing protein [bacterium]
MDRTIKGDSGFTLITVLILISILMVITGGLSYLHMVNSQLARNYFEEVQAMYLAEAGLAMAETMLYQNPSHRSPITGELTTGSYEIEFLTAREQLQQQRLVLPVEATGYAGVGRQTLAENFILEPYPQHEAYNYVLYQGTAHDLVIPAGSYISGDVFTNGNVCISTDATIEGTVYQGDAMSANLPGVDLDFYRTIADIIIADSTYIDSVHSMGGIVFIEGDAVVSGLLTPGTAIIASGRLMINDNPSDGDMVLLIGASGIVINCNSLAAVLVSPTEIVFESSTTLNGCVVSERIVAESEIKCCYLGPTGQGLVAPLPGLSIRRSDWHQRFYVPFIN